MPWTITYDSYCGFLIEVRKKANKGFCYDIFKLENQCVRSGEGLTSVQAALARAKQKIDDELMERYDIELNLAGRAHLKEFLKENVKDFDPNDENELNYYAGQITDQKRDEGVGGTAMLEIKVGESYGNVKIFRAPDCYFRVVDNGKNDF
ncbi:MAG: hypothetical protein [Bacteriophage sp.]|nr:MAG: hypothetical protein [Bacteriophage sp.]